MVALACGCALAGPWAAFAQLPPEPTPPTEPPEAGPQTPSPPVEEPEQEQAWIDERRLGLERGLGALVNKFDLFFSRDRQLDLESPSTRFRFKTYGRIGQDHAPSLGFAVGASVDLPRLERWLGNARLLVVGQDASPGAPLPTVGNDPTIESVAPVPPVEADLTASELTRRRGSVELRFDLLRRSLLVVDAGGGVTFAWPPVPFASARAHERLQLGAGLVFRATEVVFIERGGQGLGSNGDIEVARFLGPDLRLRWEGHGLYAQHTRGVVSSTLVGAEWQVRPRTGFNSGIGCSGFGTPSPGLDVCRAWLGIRQDVWRGWVFAELEPEINWPRPAGMARERMLAVTLRLEIVIESKPPAYGATP